VFMNSLGGEEVCNNVDNDEHRHRKGGGLTEDEKIQFRRRSLEHYLACGVAFAGVLSKICGVDPEEFTAGVVDCCETNKSGSVSTSASAVASSSLESTTSSPSQHYSQVMSTLRRRISTLELPITSTQADRDEFHNLIEILDDIQEAMDDAEQTELGLKMVSEMKANEIKKHEMKLHGEVDGEEENNNDGIVGGGITTTIGFQVPSSSHVEGDSILSSATVATTSVVAPNTMMIVKKKKKAMSQPAVLQYDSSKRAKTN
jgi:hypothetical protein